jgi:hypothetical protein
MWSAEAEIWDRTDGIYVLTEKVRDESWKRLHNSSLTRARGVGTA